MEATCSSETSVATQQTTRRHIPEDDTLHNDSYENLKSYNKYVILSSAITGVNVRNVFPVHLTDILFRDQQLVDTTERNNATCIQLSLWSQVKLYVSL
jgi:hypothetical protein